MRTGVSDIRAAALDKKGRALLQEGRYGEAAEVFREACRLDDSPVLANNLATACFYGGDAERALEALAPNIEPGAPFNPYAHGLAAQILASLGRGAEARAELRDAVRDFEDGLAALRREGAVPRSWKEYTVTVLRAAGSLMEHRLVYDLYRRWQGLHVEWECAYLAGVAAFNLKRFAQAARHWAAAGEMGRLSGAFQRVALLADRGRIPHFSVEYELPTVDRLSSLATAAAASEEERRRYAGRGMVRLYLLAGILDPEAEDGMVRFGVHTLVTYGGDWGRRLAQDLLDAGDVSLAVKIAAVGALVEIGVYQLDEDIPVTVDGRKETIRVQKVAVAEEGDAELEEAVARAGRLRAEEKYEDALAVLEDLQVKGRLYPPAMMMQANLYRRLGRTKEGRRLLETLEEMYPADPAVLFNLAGMWYELQDPAKARSYLERLDESLEGREVTAEFGEKLAWLRRQVNGLVRPVDYDMLVELAAEEFREAVEAKTLPVNTALSRGLRNMPAIWLDGMCGRWEIEPARTRKEREAQIAAYLGDDGNLKRTVAELHRDEVALLRFLLDKGGWSRINGVSRKFGTMEGDGYFWNETAPVSPLGRLWSQALVFVGTARIGGRNCRVAVIPVELRERLSGLLGRTS